MCICFILFFYCYDSPCPSVTHVVAPVTNGKVLAGRGLVLVTDKVRDGLILGLLDSRLVALVALTQEFLLHIVDGC